MTKELMIKLTTW